MVRLAEYVTADGLARLFPGDTLTVEAVLEALWAEHGDVITVSRDAVRAMLAVRIAEVHAEREWCAEHSMMLDLLEPGERCHA